MTTTPTTPEIERSFFTIGGTLPPDAPSYIGRKADTDLYTHLMADDFCYVLTSRQMGKSSLMVRTAVRLRESGCRVATIDLTEIGKNVTPDQWYNGMLVRLGRALGLDKQLKEYRLQADPNLGALQRWIAAIRTVVIPAISGKIVVFIDEIDGVRSLPFATDEFFEGIRNFYTDRATHPELSRITFCLVGVATPSDLIQNLSTTPFNIGYRIVLSDFTEQEAAPLIQGLNRPPRVASALLRRVLWWTGGHPYLTQRLCGAVAEDATVTSAAGVDRLCANLFLSSRSRETDNNLQFVGRRISDRADEGELAGLLDLYGRVRAGKRVPDDDTNRLIEILRLAGVVKVEKNLLVVRNRIYGHVFDQNWIRVHMPDSELRRQHEAFRRGILRTAGLGVVIIALIGFVAFQALITGERAAVQRYSADIIRLQQDLDAGDYASGLAVVAPLWSNYVRLQPNWPEPAINKSPLLQSTLRFVDHHIELYWLLNHFDDKVPESFEYDYLMARLFGYAAYTYVGHTREIRSVAISPDGSLAATAGADSTVRIFDVRCVNLSPEEAAKKFPNTSCPSQPTPVRALAVLLTNPAEAKAHPEKARYEAIPIDNPQGSSVNAQLDAQLAKFSPCDKSGSRSCYLPGIMSVRFSPDREWLAVGVGNWSNSGTPGTVYVWNMKSPGTVQHPDTKFTRTVDSVEFRPDTTEFAATSEDNTAEFFQITPQGAVTQIADPFDAHNDTTKGMNSAAYSPDGSTFAAIFGDGRLWICGPHGEHSQSAPFVADDSGLMSVAFYDNRQLLLGSRDGRVVLYDLKTKQTRKFIDTNQGLVTSITVSGDPDKNYLLTTGSSGTVLVWRLERSLKDDRSHEDPNTLDHADQIDMLRGQRDVAYAAAMTPDLRMIVSGGADTVNGAPNGRLFFWTKQPDLTPGAEPSWASQPSLVAEHGAVAALAYSPDGSRVVSIRGFSSEPGRGPDDPTEITFSQLDSQTGEPISSVSRQGHKAVGNALAWSHDGKYVATAGNGGMVLLWNTSASATDPGTGKSAYTYPPPTTLRMPDGPAIPVEALAFDADNAVYGLASPNGSFMVGDTKYCAQGTVFLWKPDVAHGPDGVPIANVSQYPGNDSSTSDKSCDTKQGTLQMPLALSADGRYTAMCGADPSSPPSTVEVWKTADLFAPNGRPMEKLNGGEGFPSDVAHPTFQGQCTALAFSPDGRWLAAGSHSNEIAVWSTHNWERVKGDKTSSKLMYGVTLPPRYLPSPPAPSAAINAIAFSPDSRRMAYATADAKIYLWDVMSQEALPVISIHEGGVLTLAFSPNGRCLASGSNDQTLRFSCRIRTQSLISSLHVSGSSPDRPETENWIGFAQ